MKIPKRFPLLSRTFKVTFQKMAEDHGFLDHNAGLVHLSLEQNDEQAFESFCHELTHAILLTSAYDKLSEDEAFVERFGGLLAQALQGMTHGDEP